MTHLRFTQLVCLETLLGLCVACGAQVKNLGDEGALGGGGAGGTTTAATEAAGGATGGTQPTAGGAAGGTQPTAGGATGGTQPTTGGATGGTRPTTSGATGGNTTQGGTGPVYCPAYDSDGGTLITPPSTGFESGLGSWTTTSQNTSAVSVTQGSTTACEGTAYLVCNGAFRNGAWDGPAIDLLPYLVAGHQYAVSIAARVDPSNSPTTDMTFEITSGLICADSNETPEFSSFQQLIATTNEWYRMSGKVETSVAGGGCTQLAHLWLYVSTDPNIQTYSIDVDDFQLWDVTPTTGTDGGA